MRHKTALSHSGGGAVFRRGAALALPFVLFAAGILLISLFVFEDCVKGSALWDFVFAEKPAEGAAEEFNCIGAEKIRRQVKPAPVPENHKPPKPVLPSESAAGSYDYIPTLPKLKEGFCVSDIGSFPLGSYWADICVYDDPLLKDGVRVYQGDNRSVLSTGVGHLYGSSFPGQGGVCVLAAHVTGKKGFFGNIADGEIYKKGTQIMLDTAYGKYVYEVTATDIRDYRDTRYALHYSWEETGKDEQGRPTGRMVDRYPALAAEYGADELLVMYTCYPKGAAFRTQRYYLICRRIYGYGLR